MVPRFADVVALFYGLGQREEFGRGRLEVDNQRLRQAVLGGIKETRLLRGSIQSERGLASLGQRRAAQTRYVDERQSFEVATRGHVRHWRTRNVFRTLPDYSVWVSDRGAKRA